MGGAVLVVQWCRRSGECVPPGVASRAVNEDFRILYSAQKGSYYGLILVEGTY